MQQLQADIKNMGVLVTKYDNHLSIINQKKKSLDEVNLNLSAIQERMSQTQTEMYSLQNEDDISFARKYLEKYDEFSCIVKQEREIQNQYDIQKKNIDELMNIS